MRSQLLLIFFIASALSFAQTRMIPHVTRAGGGFDSQVVLSNLGDDSGTLTLTGYWIIEQEMQSVTVEETVKANATVYKGIEEMFGTRDVTHFKIEGDAHVTASIVYLAQKDNAGPAHVRESSETALRWRIYLGDNRVTWDGLVVVNMGERDTPLTIFAYDAEGQQTNVLSPFWPLIPMEKEVYFLTDLFPSNPAYFEFLAADPVMIMALRGELNSTFLWKNDALPMAFDNRPPE